MKRRTAIGIFVFFCLWAQPLRARDGFVMLSGGGSPFDNNYSQYLQAKAMVAFFERNYRRDSVWVFFGAGNREGERPVLGDVLRERQKDGLTLNSWLPGTLSRNRPARREVILQALRQEILPAVAGGGTLFLFVGDHGSRTRGRNGESVITLWGLERDAKSEHGWRSKDDETLGVSEFRQVLGQGIGKGRVVFCMTQCHAGGFHYLAVPREVSPNPKWFTILPAWVTPRPNTPVLRVAGFAATDEFSAAAGCDPDPDPGEWAGYERFLPEKLLGLDLFNSKPMGKGLRSFADAHVAATLVDCTIDKPYSTSEQYLERWANLIENRLASENNLTPRLKGMLVAYQRTVDGAKPKSSESLLRERQLMFSRFIAKLAEQNPAAKPLLLEGTRKALEDAIGPRRGRRQRRLPREQNEERQNSQPSRRGRGETEVAEARKLWKESIRPAWKAVVERNQAAPLPAFAVEFENQLLQGETGKGREYFFADEDSVDEEAYWISGYSDPRTLDVAKADCIVRWGVERRRKILFWAGTNQDQQVRTAADKLWQLMAKRWSEPDTPASPAGASRPAITKKTAAERALFYRRVLAAWEFLLAANERPALATVRELTELERTPLPKPADFARPAW